MSEIPMKLIVDLSKPKGERESIVPLTAEEIAQREVDAANAAIEQAEREAVQQAQEAAKASAEAKLIALGLTEVEVEALVRGLVR